MIAYILQGDMMLFRASHYKAKGENHSAESLFMLSIAAAKDD